MVNFFLQVRLTHAIPVGVYEYSKVEYLVKCFAQGYNKRNSWFALHPFIVKRHAEKLLISIF